MATSSADTKAKLASCWETDVNWELYPPKLKEGCGSIAKAMSMPPTAVLSGLMIIVSFLLAHSDVQVEGRLWREPVILWVSIGMPTGSGKSSLFAYFLTLLSKIRMKCGRKDIHPSWTVEESSFEKMGALMFSNEGKLLGLYDELSSFLTQINLYGSKGISDSHDMATFLMLYNGHPWARRTVTGHANFHMEKTALTVGGFTQPSVARIIIEQTTGAERGFSQRFLWIFPKPTFAKFASLQPVSEDVSTAIVTLLTDLWKAGGGDKPKQRTWILPQTCKIFTDKYDEIQDELEDLGGIDDLLTGILSKSKGQILCLAAVFNALFSLDEAHELTETLSEASVRAAINFIEVCSEHAAIIGGRKNAISPLVSSPISGGKSELDIATHCLLLPGNNLNLSTLLDKKKFRMYVSKPGALKGFKYLENDGMGTLEVCGGRGINKLYHFKKRPLPADDDSDELASFATKLSRYNASITDYKSSWDNIDVPWQVNVRKSPRKQH